MKRLLLLVLALLFTMSMQSIATEMMVSSEEFVGPLAGWKNLKADFGAVGDGKADDTAAIKAGLESLAVHGKGKPGDPYVLYLPAGTYRITEPLHWSNRLGVAVLGEDPVTTRILYDGPLDQAILTCDGVSYSKFGRITWDGQGKASAAVVHHWDPVKIIGPAVTYMEHADEVFTNVRRGIVAGKVVPVITKEGTLSHYNHGMDAETLVRRCKFIRCTEAGLSIQSFNALDWWVWDSEFIDCGIGATNCVKGEYGGGHFHLYRCVFRGSKESDIRTGHTSYFGFRFNTSIGSRRFLEAIRPEGFNMPGLTHPTVKAWGAWPEDGRYGAMQMLQGNRIINPTDPTPIYINQHGPLMLFDNTFVVKPDGDEPVVQVTPPTDGAQCVSIGNQFYGASRVQVRGELTALDNQTHDYSKADLSDPYPPPFAPKVERRIFEITKNAPGAEIQAAIDEAVKLVGQKPVVHIPAGNYKITRTLQIPAGSDVQLIGDGQETNLRGDPGITVLKIAGPSRATLRDFRIRGGAGVASRGIVADNVDQPGGQILLDQVNASYSARQGLLFDGLTRTRVEGQGSGGGGNSGPGLTVIGGGENTKAWVGFFGGAGSNNQQTHLVKNDSHLLIWDTWYETAVSKKDSEPRYIHLTDRGNISFVGGHIATLPGKEARRDLYSIDLDGFKGRFTLIGAMFNTLNPQVRLAGTGENMKVLMLGTAFGETEPYFDNQASKAQVATLACKQKSKPLNPTGNATPEFLREMLSDARTILPTRWQPAPAGTTDLRLHRVCTYVNVSEGMIFSAGKDDVEAK
jgi:hypothetical protein